MSTKHFIVSETSIDYLAKCVPDKRKNLILFLKNGKEAPPEITAETKKDLVEAVGIDYTFDYALPQGWVDDVTLHTGESPVPHFVWGYPENGMKGPVPITETGKILLRIYTHMKR